MTIRERICDEYGRYPVFCLRQKITPDYIAEMRQYAKSSSQLSRWGSDAEIMMFCRVYNARVTVFSPTYPAPGYSLVFENDQGLAPAYDIALVHRHGNHWRYLKPPG
ncbi:hypothetical protein HH212_18630 [Massilia forsythiae]|uniref:OTU domain-containing protein n=1 Tax=Massilia forsythiae TaxID=2728020 RepID=A0A7Z2ZU03_9BURK|nr:OTU domain-containing protein [Massilia forsythiae]QJE01795.1 hypothetical protein HH212_18630 [Massilia forsythiae]